MEKYKSGPTYQNASISSALHSLTASLLLGLLLVQASCTNETDEHSAYRTVLIDLNTAYRSGDERAYERVNYHALSLVAQTSLAALIEDMPDTLSAIEQNGTDPYYSIIIELAYRIGRNEHPDAVYAFNALGDAVRASISANNPENVRDAYIRATIAPGYGQYSANVGRAIAHLALSDYGARRFRLGGEIFSIARDIGAYWECTERDRKRPVERGGKSRDDAKAVNAEENCDSLTDQISNAMPGDGPNPSLPIFANNVAQGIGVRRSGCYEEVQGNTVNTLQIWEGAGACLPVPPGLQPAGMGAGTPAITDTSGGASGSSSDSAGYQRTAPPPPPPEELMAKAPAIDGYAVVDATTSEAPGGGQTTSFSYKKSDGSVAADLRVFIVAEGEGEDKVYVEDGKIYIHTETKNPDDTTTVRIIDLFGNVPVDITRGDSYQSVRTPAGGREELEYDEEKDAWTKTTYDADGNPIGEPVVSYGRPPPGTYFVTTPTKPEDIDIDGRSTTTTGQWVVFGDDDTSPIGTLSSWTSVTAEVTVTSTYGNGDGVTTIISITTEDGTFTATVGPDGECNGSACDYDPTGNDNGGGAGDETDPGGTDGDTSTSGDCTEDDSGTGECEDPSDDPPEEEPEDEPDNTETGGRLPPHLQCDETNTELPTFAVFGDQIGPLIRPDGGDFNPPACAENLAGGGGMDTCPPSVLLCLEPPPPGQCGCGSTAEAQAALRLRFGMTGQEVCQRARCPEGQPCDPNTGMCQSSDGGLFPGGILPLPDSPLLPGDLEVLPLLGDGTSPAPE